MLTIKQFFLKNKPTLIVLSILTGLIITGCLGSAIFAFLKICFFTFVGFLTLMILIGYKFSQSPLAFISVIATVTIFLLGKYGNWKLEQKAQSQSSAAPVLPSSFSFPWMPAQQKEENAKNFVTLRQQKIQSLLFAFNHLQKVLPKELWSEWLKFSKDWMTAKGMSATNCKKCNVLFLMSNPDISEQQKQEDNTFCQDCLKVQ